MSYNYLDKTGLASVWAKIKAALALKVDSTALADIATSGSYEDLNDIPEILTTNDDVVMEDKVPYLFRKSPDSDRAVEEIVGGSVVWNQLTRPREGQRTDNGVTITGNDDGSVELNGTTNGSGALFAFQDIGTIINHIYLFVPKGLVTGLSLYTNIGGNVTSDSAIIRKALDSSNRTTTVRTDNGVSYSDVVVRLNVFDLTTMFGTQIADYIYSLEQATAGAGVAKLKEWGFFTEDYYEYCEPTLRSVEGLVSKKTVGWNQWDEEWEEGAYDVSTGHKNSSDANIRSKNLIKILPNATYFIKSPYTYGLRVVAYDADGEFLSDLGYKNNATFISPNDCGYITFFTNGADRVTVYNGGICINLSDPTRNGQYLPYESHSYPLDSTLTLRGIPKLDFNNNLYFDGDVYPADGQGERRFTERAYQSGDESLADAITDGTTTVVKLSTPTTFTAQPYHNPQIVGDTEEWVTTGIVPVGHSTKYHTSYYITNDYIKEKGYLTEKDVLEKVNTSDLATVATSGSYNDLDDKPTKVSDFENDAAYMSGMTILAYGKNNWTDFITAYTEKKVVYCRASSSSNPASGSQTRLAFMAYVNNADNPTEVEFQYYRSVSSHSNNQQGDQVYVYKLNKSNGWSVTVRESYTKVVAGTGLSGNWASGAITLSLNSNATATTSANGLMSSTDKSRLDALYADYSSALTALGVN